jgi:hypothetical protein
MLEGAGMPVMFNPVGSGVETPTAPERAAKDDITRRIGASQSRHVVNAGSDDPWMYSLRLEQGGFRSHRSARYS